VSHPASGQVSAAAQYVAMGFPDSCTAARAELFDNLIGEGGTVTPRAFAAAERSYRRSTMTVPLTTNRVRSPLVAT
jgi:hypothetical protein